MERRIGAARERVRATRDQTATMIQRIVPQALASRKLPPELVVETELRDLERTRGTAKAAVAEKNIGKISPMHRKSG